MRVVENLGFLHGNLFFVNNSTIFRSFFDISIAFFHLKKVESDAGGFGQISECCLV